MDHGRAFGLSGISQPNGDITQIFQGRVIVGRIKGPAQPGSFGTPQILSDGAPGDIAARSDFLIGTILLPLQAKDFFDLAHG